MGADTNGSTVTVTNPIGRGYGALEISKRIDGELAGSVDEGITFTGTWTCTYGDSTRNGEWSLDAGESKTVATNLLVGSDCSVAEDATEQAPNAKDASYAWLPAAFEGNHSAIAANAPAKIGVVNSIERKLGTLAVTKKLSGETAGFTGGENESFTVTYTCVNPLDEKAARGFRQRPACRQRHQDRGVGSVRLGLRVRRDPCSCRSLEGCFLRLGNP